MKTEATEAINVAPCLARLVLEEHMKETQTKEEDRLRYEIFPAVGILLLQHACAQLCHDSFHKMEKPAQHVQSVTLLTIWLANTCCWLYKFCVW